MLAVALATWLVAAILAFVQTPIYKSTALIQVDGTRINLVQGVTIDDGLASSAELCRSLRNPGEDPSKSRSRSARCR